MNRMSVHSAVKESIIVWIVQIQVLALTVKQVSTLTQMGLVRTVDKQQQTVQIVMKTQVSVLNVTMDFS